MTAKRLEELCGKKVFRITGKRFLVLADSLKEYEYYLTQLKQMFDVSMKLDVENKDIATPVILSGIINASIPRLRPNPVVRRE